MNTKTLLWVEKYRPSTFDDYVWRDQNMKSKAQEWVDQGAIPHLMLSGKAGLGKTSLAKLLLKSVGVPKSDILEINASRYRKIDEMQDKILGFISTFPEIDNKHQIKYVLLEEADSMSRLSYRFLRAEMERNVDHVRFIFTCNYVEKIEPTIVSRCQSFHFEALDQEEFVNRLVDILDQEQVEYNVDTVIDYIDTVYPDLRKCIGLIQQNTIGGKLSPLQKGDGDSFDYIADIVGLFMSGNHRQAREMIVSQASPDEYPEIFRFMYKNLELWGDNDTDIDRALIVIRDGLYKNSIVSDPEINMAATIAELAMIRK